jgi:hypothetical protein
MASTPKIRVSIPKSLNITASERAALKSAFQAEVIRVLKRPESAVRSDIINIIPTTGASKKSKKAKKGKKAGKKK